VPADKELEQELMELSAKVERLRTTYQQFFMGVEKKPPDVQRDQLERHLRATPLNEVRRAAIKFRFQSVIQRYRTYEIYWDRVIREIETGRFRREQAERAPAPVDEEPAENATPRARERGRAKAPRTPGEAELARLYQAFLDARMSCGLTVEGITPEAFRQSLERQRRLHSARLGVPDVSFSVVVKEGRVVLLARPVSGPH